MSKFAVIIRHLHQHRPVTSKIIEESHDPAVDDEVHYLLSKAQDHVREFTNEFVEFKRAQWYVDIIDQVTGAMCQTGKIELKDL